MSFETWLLFCATEAVLCFTPGPAVLLVVSLSLSRGPRSGLGGSLGILVANALYFAISATGLGAVLLASWQVFIVIKWVGAAYLVWLGIRMFVLASSEKSATEAPSSRGGSPLQRSFPLGFFTQGANPKAIVFFAAILPQFIDPTGSVAWQILILGVSSVLIELVVLSIYVAACKTARAWSGRPRLAIPLQRVGGLLLITAGARLAVIRRG